MMEILWERGVEVGGKKDEIMVEVNMRARSRKPKVWR
jgi:hypothetical protein